MQINYVVFPACYGSFVLPKLAQGVEITCELLMKLAGQDSVYVQLLEYKAAEEESFDHLVADIFAFSL